MSNYVLEWPGLGSVPFVIIDPVSKMMFNNDRPLPVDQQSLDVFENKYVKLSLILDLISEHVQQEAQWVLKELLDRFNVQKLVTSSASQNSSTYVPITTLLALIMVWPCCKVFQSVTKSVYNYLNTFSDSICLECGWAQRECCCSKQKNSLSPSLLAGYATRKIERSSQTTENMQTSGTNNINVSSKQQQPQNISSNFAYLLPQSVVLPPPFNWHIVQPPVMTQQALTFLPNDVWNNRLNRNHVNDSLQPLMFQNIATATPAFINSNNNSMLHPSLLPSNNMQSNMPVVNNSNLSESNTEEKSDATKLINHVRPFCNVSNQSASTSSPPPSSVNRNNSLFVVITSRQGFCHKQSMIKKRKIDCIDAETGKSSKLMNKNKKLKVDRKDRLDALTYLNNNIKIDSKSNKSDSALPFQPKPSKLEAEQNDSNKKTVKLWKLVEDYCMNNDDEFFNFDENLLSNDNSGKSKNNHKPLEENDEKDECRLKIDETGDSHSNELTKKDGRMVKNCKASNVKKIYAMFQYIPTGEHIFRCTVSKCGQCFDTERAAILHCYAHVNNEHRSTDSHSLNNNNDVTKNHHDSNVKNATNTNSRLGKNVTASNFSVGDVKEQSASNNNNSNSHYYCHKCNFKVPFFHWFDLLRHFRMKHGLRLSEKCNSCKHCGLSFDCYNQLMLHMEFHYSNRYKCIHCGILLLTWKQVQRHLETCVNRSKRSSSSVNLGCPYCTFVFHKKNLRNLHTLSHSDVGLSCAICENGIVWSDWKSLRKHYQQKHSKVLLEKITPHRRDLPIKQKPPKCKICNVEFKSFDLYSNHMLRTHDFVPYTLIECKQCERQFRTEKSYEWHVKHVHVQEISCEKCSYATTSKSLLKLHMTQKHGDKQHTCSECEKSFTYFQQLRVHMAHHARKSIFACQDCDMEFNRNSDLRAHQQQEHLESYEKAPENCPECEFRCFSRQTLNVHIRKNHQDTMHSNSIDESEDSMPGTRSSFESHQSSHRAPTPPSVSQPAQSADCREVASKKSSLSAALDITSVSKRGRKRKMSSKLEWETMESEYSGDERKEKKKVEKVQKDVDDKIRKLRKSTCARTRNFNEHKADKNSSKFDGGFTFNHDRGLASDNLLVDDLRAVSSPSTASINDEGSGLVPADALNYYPYLDHSYFKFDTTTIGLDNQLSSSSSTTVVAKLVSSSDTKLKPSSSSNVVSSESCNQISQASGMTNFSYRTTRRQVAFASSNDATRLSNCYSPPDIVSSIVPVQSLKVDDQPADLTSEMFDVDFTAESELVKSAGGHCLIKDVLKTSFPIQSASRCLTFNDDECDEDGFVDDMHRTLIDLNGVGLCDDDLNMFKGGIVDEKEETADRSSILQKLNSYFPAKEYDNWAILASAPDISFSSNNSFVDTSHLVHTSSHDISVVTQCISTPKSNSSRLVGLNDRTPGKVPRSSRLQLTTRFTENHVGSSVGTSMLNNHSDEGRAQQDELDVSNANDDSSNHCPDLDDVDTSGLLSISGSGSNNSFDFYLK